MIGAQLHKPDYSPLLRPSFWLTREAWSPKAWRFARAE